ncbi:RNA polymerase sigma factor [Phenylobacterium sp.]|uniref:RNA polymerase sigma factor n=1 Tax=Phenylobacterium sp. TaxID=1871053 RepID=UPI0030F4288E
MSARDDVKKGASAAEDSLSQLYRRYAGWLERLVRGKFGADGAEDLVQETYLRVRAYQASNVVRHPKALLLRIATNLAYDRARRAKVRVGRGVTSLEEARHVRQLVNQAEQVEALLLKQIVLSLPPAQRDVLVLNRFANLSYEEIASHLGISVKTVEWRMSKALAHCAKLLRP